MHRFRKKSDVKRSQLPSLAQFPPTPAAESRESLPELPPAGDFRTSVILPDLSRRFSLLRSSSGDPVSLDELRNRFAEQRARGAEHQISEEEEDMLLETLGRIRPKPTGFTTPERSQENILTDGDDFPAGSSSIKSGSSSFAGSSPGGRSTKRYSNNLFGSGRLRDYTYMRSVSSSKGSSAGSTRTVSMTPTESSRANTASVVEAQRPDSMRPVTPEGSMHSHSLSAQSSPNDRASVRNAPIVPSAPYGEQSLTAAEYRLAKTLGPSVLKRASMALEEVIKEIEDEVEDEIVMPRSVPVPRGSLEQPRSTPEVRNSDVSNTSSVYEAGMAISSDKQAPVELDERRASPLPSRILPGYVPGMPRPMTPRDFDSDDQRSHSTTPRATSPMHSSFAMDSAASSPGSASITSGLFRRESASNSRQSPRPTTPLSSSTLFLQRSTNGRYTPEDSSHHRGDSNEFDNPLNSSTFSSRRRPASPLAAGTFQPMAVSSRPSTPSNIIWNPSLSGNNKPAPTHSTSGHNRNDSWISEGAVSSSDLHGHTDQGRVRSPAPSDLPIVERTTPQTASFSTSPPNTAIQPPPSNAPAMELGSPVLAPTRAPHSPTPTQAASRSPPTSPTYSNFEMSSRNGSRRSSKQNTSSSPFNLNSFPVPLFSPIANSSRSSLESAGSSFHSWDDGKDKFSALFGDGEVQPSWHEIVDSEKSTPGGSPEEEWDAEEIIKRYAKLKKSDFVAIQEKLVSVAVAKAANPETRERAPSSLRRRRPSTSQSNYSTSGRPERVASPPPGKQQLASPTSPTSLTTPTPDQYSKLLNSVVDSIQSREIPPPINTTTVTPAPPSDPSPTTRRNRDLAHVLFGVDDDEDDEDRAGKTPKPEQQAAVKAASDKAISDNAASSVQYEPPSRELPSVASSLEPPPSDQSPYQMRRNLSQPRIPHTPQESADLVREVQQKTEAAMAALRKRPSNSNLQPDGMTHSGSISRRRISPSDISKPLLVSATTSVDTIPLRSPSLTASNNSGPSKIGSRFRKFRGTLRAKNTIPTPEDVTPFPIDSKSPPASQTAHYDPAKLKIPGGPGLSSATEANRFKVPVASPPASAGPGLRGFMARFRNKQRSSETPQESEPRASLQMTPSSPSLQGAQVLPPSRAAASDTGSNSTIPRPDRTTQAPATNSSATSSIPISTPSPEENIGAADDNESAALKQLFDAAGSLGLDQSALTDLLARSGSTSSRSNDWAFLSRSNSTVKTARPDTRDPKFGDTRVSSPPSHQAGAFGQISVEEPQTYETSPVIYPNGQSNGERPDESISKRPSVHKPAEPTRRPRENLSENAGNAVVRRTIIYPSDTKELNVLMRKNSSRRRRASATSVSSRSVHDRAPTPPPPRSPTSKRFSSDISPPVPQLPHSLAQSEHLLSIPSTSGGPIEKSNSTYDSLYDMYAGESRAVSTAGPDSIGPGNLQSTDGGVPSSEAGPALEVIELANGETIWSIVNGLRDEDEASVYTGRASFASEYSREGTGEGVQIFVKEHGRAGSKGSSSSFLSRKKPSQGKSRPETKVFYSSSAQIGRLIENLSQGMDAGSFNFLPSTTRAPGAGHSATSSLSTNDIHWTVEERLEHMLGSMGSS